MGFDEFYRAELDRQVRRCFLLTGSAEIANDIVHDAMVDVYRRWLNIGVRHVDAPASGDMDPDHPLYGKVLAFTGGMFSMSRSEAADLITSLGATFKKNMSAAVDYLVIGDADFVSFADGQMTGKLTRAVELRNEGSTLEILSERDFVGLVNS